MEQSEPNGFSPEQLKLSFSNASFSFAFTSCNKSIVVVSWSQPGKTVQTYLEQNGYRVVTATPDAALEIIRWEQPALALLDGGLHGEQSFQLLRRLEADNLTRELDLIIWALEPAKSNLPAKLRQVSWATNLEELEAVIHRLRPRLAQRVTLSAANPFLWVGSSKPVEKVRELLANSRLRRFVNEVIDGWPTLAVVGYLAQETDAVVNVEMLCHHFDLMPHESAAAIGQLARAGYIEPLEFEGCDPLFGPVADPQRLSLLTELALALAEPSYAMVVTTLVLARERTAHQ